MHMFTFASSLREAIQLRADIPEHEIEDLIANMQRREFTRGENFVRQGDPASSVGFVENGLFKAYGTSPKGMAYIRNFCSSGYFIGSYAAAIQSEPADMTIQALEDAVVIEVSFEILKSFFERSLNWQKLARTLAETHYIERELKEFRLLSLSAVERYQLFWSENPHLQGRISQADVASYIGVTPESLSRILKALQKSV